MQMTHWKWTLAALLGLAACSHTTSAPHALPPLPAARARIAQVASQQQVRHGDACPSGFVPSEIPGDWCYRTSTTLIAATDIASKFVIRQDGGGWAVVIQLRPAAAVRVASFSTQHPGQDTAIIDGDDVVAVFPVPAIDPDGPNTSWSLDRMSEAQAVRISRALGGADITKSMLTIPPPPTAP